MRIMKPSEEKGVKIEVLNNVFVSPENIIQANGVYYAGTGFPPPAEDVIQILQLKMDTTNGHPADIAKILKVGYALEKWPTSEGEQAIYFGDNPNITNTVEFELIYIHQN